MSRGPDDRPRETAPKSPLPPLDQDAPGGQDEPTTFRPVPGPKPASKSKGGSGTRPRNRPTDETAFRPAAKGRVETDAGGPGWLERIVFGSVGSGSLGL